MNPKNLTIAIMAVAAAPAAYSETLWSDNFNVADSTSLDASDIASNPAGASRRGGTAATAIQARSSRIQHGLIGGQLNFLVTPPGTGTGRIRFHVSGDGTNRFDFASGPVGASILANGGLRVEFDWIAGNNTSDNWISFDVGLPTTAEPATRVNDAGTDHGILFRYTAGVQTFHNGVVTSTRAAVFPAAIGTRHVVLDYTFSSFADETPVTLNATVDGYPAYTGGFTWVGNANQLFMELETLESTRIDNLRISTPPFSVITTGGTVFKSGLAAGGLVTTFEGTRANSPDASTFALVAGIGDTDNGKFQIVDGQLQANGFDFKTAENGTVYKVRVKGTTSSGDQDTELAFTVTLFKDDDLDDLRDDFEMTFAGNLTDLNGLAFGPGPGAGTGDFDGDGLTDLAEYELSIGAVPGINPTKADTDGDGLSDGEERVPSGQRPVTSPILSDTEFDGLSDLVETNSGVFVGPADSGTDPTVQDTDFDGARDGFEVARLSDPLDVASMPALPSGFAVKAFTGEGDIGISTSKTYTHKVTGGDGAATVGGVVFDNLTPTLTPPDFTWASGAVPKMQVVATNLNNWVPENGGLATTETAVRALLGGFSYANSSAGMAQTYTLSGLTPGTTYDVRIYIRLWATNTLRPIDLKFTNGTQVEMPFGALLEDRAGLVLGNDNNDTPYYLSFTYTAQGTDLIIEAKVPNGSPVSSGGFHLYALTNEVVPVSSALAVTGVKRLATGEVVIDFRGLPDTTYRVTKSSNLVVPFGPLTIPLTATTNVGGIGQAIVPASEASEPSEFYRIEQ